MMIKKKRISTLALLLTAAIGLTGCDEQETAPVEDNAAEEQETTENDNQSENDGGEQTEADEEDTESEPDEDVEEGVDEAEEADDEEETQTSIFGDQEDFVYVSADRLSVRSDSDENSQSLGNLFKGNEVTVLEEAESEDATWYKISYHNSENNEGWISAEFTVDTINELHSSPAIFEDEEMNEYFTSPDLFEENRVVAYYGHPNSEVMGIVGRHPVQDLISLLNETADSYDEADDDMGTIPAIYLVYGTVQPGGEISKMNYDLVMSYIEAAYQSGVLVYIDHQIGRHDPAVAISEIVSFMRYPNVHLALDPEWRTARPMQEVGHITGPEINEVQGIMQEYIDNHEIPGIRQFVFHQFIEKMIHDVGSITTDQESVLVVHNTSGWGSPEGKRTTHERVTEASPIPYKGFKLWYHYSDDPGVHYDNPLMTPEQVLDLDPQPNLVIYQ